MGDPAPSWVELDPRAVLLWGPLLVAGLMAWPVLLTWRAWRRTTGRRWLALATAIVSTAVLVVAPLALTLDTATSRVRVSASGIELVRWGRVHTALEFDDVSRVEVGRRGSLGPLTPGRSERYVRLVGRDRDGDEVVVLVTSARVQSLDPLLAALEPVIEDRPAISTRDDRG